MRRRCDYEDDRLARREAAVAVYRRGAHAGPARFRLGDDARDLRLRHAGIMLDLQRREPGAFVAAEADEGDDGAEIGSAGDDTVGFLGRIERLGLYAYAAQAVSLRSSAGRTRPRALRRFSRRA